MKALNKILNIFSLNKRTQYESLTSKVVRKQTEFQDFDYQELAFV
jgi:hypothetical protein